MARQGKEQALSFGRSAADRRVAPDNHGAAAGWPDRGSTQRHDGAAAAAQGGALGALQLGTDCRRARHTAYNIFGDSQAM